ncbi:polysaccharide biosynthesis/export family protein [Prochlorococcus marinus]|uniref:polysaccharide biosynthesis/export family protein n=1 Tax=Prochlorococcus marinus TaxID=1219 RepID=UPI001ADD20C2|nr:polysaccharide biosynthesis/export family protein [Prochlorococcus marinus]MBO8221416.1 polysaccharide export protein [Prochlorococcus marinus CUG1417]MBW3074226.1 hypothetical protein [Prochlorococcus marinus str. MU1417]
MRKNIFFTFIFIGIFNIFFPILPAASEDININDSTNIGSNNFKNSISSTSYNYLIGSGDILELKFTDLEVYNGEFQVLNDGWIFLPVIGNYFIENKTLEEARNDLISKYSKELIVPDLQLSLSHSRPLDISIIGEVQKPGLYQIEDILENPPRLVDGLQLAGGITSKSNLEDVKLIRLFKEDGELIKKITSLNLISLVEDGDQSNNIKLSHGDVLKINSTNEFSKTQYKLAKATLAPAKIGITVVGEVKAPGEKMVVSGVSLIEAIMIAGGPVDWQANRQNIQLIREDEYGAINVSRYKYNINKNNSIINNPILKDGDIINVNAVNYTKFSRGVQTIFAPLRDIITGITFYELINDD